MTIIIPDNLWYKEKSKENSVPAQCPYANVHKCYRYYESLNQLGKYKIITSIDSNHQDELDEFWSKSNIKPILMEENPGVSSIGEKIVSFHQFCPEVTFSHICGYYANYLAKYTDEYDRDCGEAIAQKEGLKNDWRYRWERINPCHFLDCRVYVQVHDFNYKSIGNFTKLVHSNIIKLIGRMEKCLEDNDPSGVLHAASNILETMAKDILNDGKLTQKTLGSFIEKYKKESSLPEEIKNVVGNIYDLRNKTPLSGHGSTEMPNIDIKDAIIIAVTTKFIVEIEYRLRTKKAEIP